MDMKHSHSFAFVCWSDGPRPSQKEIISLRAFMLLFLKQLILKVQSEKCLIIITQPAGNCFMPSVFFFPSLLGCCRPNLKFECLFRELHWKMNESLWPCVCVWVIEDVAASYASPAWNTNCLNKSLWGQQQSEVMMDVLSTGPRREGGRATEHPQLPSDHAWGEGLCVCQRGPAHRQTVTAAEWGL